MESILEEPDDDTIESLVHHVKSCLHRRRFDEVLSVSNKIWELDKEESLSWYFKGKAYLELNDFTNAINSFEMALDLGIVTAEDARDAREMLTVARTKKTLNSVTRNWYQTESHVVIHVMAKNMRRQHVHVLFEDKNVICSMKIPPFNVFYDLFLNLANTIVPENCVIVVLKNKVEIRMEKEDKGVYWDVLDLDTKAKYAKNGEMVKTFWKIPESDEAKDIDYRVWEQIESGQPNEDMDKEKTWDSDEALHRLFRHMYNEGEGNKKKAMLKSFVESRGTTLTTSWEKAEETKFSVKIPKNSSHHVKWG